MRRPRLKTRLKAIINGLVVLIIPLLVFVFGNQRKITIAGKFLTTEATHHTAELCTLSAIALLFMLIRISSVWPLIRVAFASWRRPIVGAIVAFALVLTVLSIQYVRVRYRVFSEVLYPRLARTHILRGDFVAARLTCEEYLRLYPGRAIGGRIEDPVCTDILAFQSDAAVLRDYVIAQVPRPVERADGIAIPYGWGTRARAIKLLELFAGGTRSPQASRPKNRAEE